MSTAGGPKLYGIGRGGDSDIVLCMDAHDAGSYPGEPTTNLIPYYSSRNTALVASVFSAEALWTSRANSTDVIAPDGSSTTTKAVTGTTGNSYLYTYMDAVLGVTMASSTTYTLSVWAKTTSTASTTVSLAFQDRGNGAYDLSSKTITTEWQRFSLTITTGGGATSNTLIGWNGPTNSRTFYFWGWQVEQKGYATPYVVSQLLDPSAQGPSARPASTNLMIHGNVGTGQTFSDSSPSKHTITTVGNTTHSTAQSKFSGGSIYFDGSDGLQIADSDDWNFGSGDYTLDCWIHPTAVNIYGGIINQGEHSGNYQLNSLEMYTDGTGNIRWLIRNTSPTQLLDIKTPSGSIALNTWYHIAAVKNGTSYKIYIDGVESASGTQATALEDLSWPMYIGQRSVSGGANYYYQGYIDEARITKGTALWTSNFTPPTRRNLSAPVVDLSGNHNGANLITGTDTDTSTYRVGEVIRPIDSAFWDFDGTDEHLTTPFGSGRNVYTNPISVCAWIKTDLTAPNKMWLDVGSNGTNQRFYCALIDANSPNNFGIQGQAWGYGATSDTTKWYHQAIVMDNGTARAYYDGIAGGTKGFSSYTLPSNIIIGGRGGYEWNGQIAAVQIYDTILTPQQVKENFNSQRSRFKV